MSEKFKGVNKLGLNNAGKKGKLASINPKKLTDINGNVVPF